MSVIARCEVELCRDCEAGRSTRPLIECQHIGPDDAGAVVEFVRADIHTGAVKDRDDLLRTLTVAADSLGEREPGVRNYLLNAHTTFGGQ